MQKKLKGLYAITDEKLTPQNIIVDRCMEALDCGVRIIQHRDKNSTDNEVEKICIELQELCRRYDAVFIINDRPHLAQKIGADGLHIGKDDMPFSETRKIYTEGIIGVSCYGSLDIAKEAQINGAAYVAFGAFFPTPTKPDSGVFPMDVLGKAKKSLNLPVCAIGGINSSNIDIIDQHKPDMLCCVSAIFDGNIKENIRLLNQKIKERY
ncbi:MAG: thiamine phosphate synthase [Sulfurospirillaceae bacterium]|nr:thiamine phosphate synthase [Sulfurospirillaceae bacterium]